MASPNPFLRFRHTRQGVVVALPKPERKVLKSVVEQFRQLLFSGSDPNLTRLEPPACPKDPDTEIEYRAMASTQLLRHRLEAIDVVEAGLNGATLKSDAVAAWMQTLNGIRLYMGERLGVSGTTGLPSDDHPDANLVPLYKWLGSLLEQLVDAASEGLPPDIEGLLEDIDELFEGLDGIEDLDN